MNATPTRSRRHLPLCIGAAAVAVALAACGGAQHQAAHAGDAEPIQCKGRHADYAVVGGFVAPESGVEITCKDGVARVVAWRMENKAGKRHSRSRRLGEAEFEKAWQGVEDTGWRNLSDCNNANAGKGDPVYTFHISDLDKHISVTCRGKSQTLPFPYDRLVTQFDLLSGSISD